MLDLLVVRCVSEVESSRSILVLMVIVKKTWTNAGCIARNH